MGLFSRGNDMLNRRLPQAEGITLTYRRGGTSLTVTDAVVGRTAFVSNQQGAARVEWGDRDYLIPVASLADLGEPAEGDRITEAIGGVDVTFKVMKPDTGERAWRWSDPTRTVYRLHCKEVAS